MTEYIERDVVLSHKWKVRSYDPSDPDPVTEVVSVSSIMRIPTADVVEVRHGRWISAYPDIEPNPMFMYGVCSQCGFEQSISDKLNYCPNCGAKMDGGPDDGV